eukprot:SAG22_NODE_95_length_20791_cov_40.318514_9_plen_94_part_00
MHPSLATHRPKRPAAGTCTAAVVLLVAACCGGSLPRAGALSAEETADLQGLCDLNPGAIGETRQICRALDAGQDPCDVVTRVYCTADDHLRSL